MRIRIPTSLFQVLALAGILATQSPGQEIRDLPSPGRAQPSVQKANPGPWGDLEFWEIWLEPPTQLILAANYFSEQPVWRIPLMDEAGLRRYFVTHGLTPAEIDTLAEPGRISTEKEWIEVIPPLSLIESLSPERRQRLYHALSRWGYNRFQVKPFSLGNDTVTSLANVSPHSIPSEVLTYADQLIYRRGPQSVLADFPLVIRKIPELPSRIEFTKILMRARSLMVRLKISPGTDLDELRTYWSAGRRNRDILPILDAVSSTPDANYIDIVHLLPPSPRKFLYAYPRASMAVGNEFPDCFWTAFNFLEPETSDRNLDRPVSRLIGNRWLEVEPPLHFGDMIIVEELDTGDALHACTYLADDLVYTKNGLSLLRPFVIEELDSVMHGYLDHSLSRLRYFRHQDLVEEEEEEVEAAKATP